VIRPSCSVAATAATRPLISADPMLRAARPEIAPESNRAGRTLPAACCPAAWLDAITTIAPEHAISVCRRREGVRIITASS